MRGKNKLLTKTQIAQAKRLWLSGTPHRKIAEIYGVGKTTIWDYLNPQKRKKRAKIQQKLYTFAKIRSVSLVVKMLLDKDYTSQEISETLEIPLKEVNIIITKML